MKIEKEKAEKELEESLIELGKAWKRCVSACSNIYIECNDFIQGDYPFNQSFDEIDFDTWIENSVESFYTCNLGGDIRDDCRDCCECVDYHSVERICRER